MDADRGKRILDAMVAARASGIWPEPIDLAALAVREPQPPAEIMTGLPAGYATLLAGHGGVGKSGIALHLGACMAAERRFAGLAVARKRVLYLSCEDREGVLHWRLARICAHLGIELADLVGWLDVLDLVGHDCVLWDASTDRPYTPAFGALAERIRQSGADVIFVDGISDTFAGNENARTDVKRYVNALLGLVPADSGALVLIGHVAKLTASGTQTGEGYSGSTGWHNSVRARWYLYPETERDDDDGKARRTGRLQLELQKANHGRTDLAIAWQWDEDKHMFLPEPAPSHFDRRTQEREEIDGILRAMLGCMQSDIAVPAATQGQRTAYLVLSERPEFPASLKGRTTAKTRRFWRHIEHLRQIRQIDVGSYRRANRHVVETVTLTTEGMRQCAE